MKNKFNFSRRNPKTKKIENTGFMEFRNVSNNAADLYIYGDIVSSTWEAWCDEDTCPQDISDFMNQIEPGAELTVYINSGGGDVFAGIAIHSILSRHTGHKTGIVDGMAASIASVILMACDSIVMSSGAQIMIHKPLSWAYGNADDFQRLISELDKCQKSITDIYMGRALESRAGWKGLCRKGVTLLFVLIAYRLDLALGVNYIRNAVIIGFMANELISITENAGLMGIPLPTVIQNAIEVLTRKASVSKDGEQ